MCIMHDVIELERSGLPSVAVVTDVFLQQAEFQATKLGATEPDRLFTLARHPVSDQTPDQLVAKAVDVYPDVVRGLTSESKIAALRKRALAGKMSDECAAGA